MTALARPHQLDADESAVTIRLRLVPPLSPSFHVYGEPTTVERARAWALARRLMLVRGVPSCPHGFYGMDACPGSCRSLGDLDHADVWYRHPDGQGGPSLFILAHPYTEAVPRAVATLAEAHGLEVASHRIDGWYSDATIPVRITAPTGLHVWPIEPRLLALATLLPATWDPCRFVTTEVVR